jgi:hypothetical protein
VRNLGIHPHEHPLKPEPVHGWPGYRSVQAKAEARRTPLVRAGARRRVPVTGPRLLQSPCCSSYGGATGTPSSAARVFAQVKRLAQLPRRPVQPRKWTKLALGAILVHLRGAPMAASAVMAPGAPAAGSPRSAAELADDDDSAGQGTACVDDARADPGAALTRTWASLSTTIREPCPPIG